MSDNIVELSKASKIYGSEVKTYALKAVDLQIKHGEFAAILGPSGSGKSTLLNLIGALDTPTTGEVLIDGVGLSTLGAAELSAIRQKYLGFVFQFHYLLPDFTALENVLMPYWISGGGTSKAQVTEAHELLNRVGLSQKHGALPRQLSGGQQQRVAIARALAQNRSIVLADEPTGNLDTVNGAEAFALMRDFNVNAGVTFLIVTHDQRLAMQTDRIIEIVDGSIAYDGPSASYKEGATPS